MIIQCSACQTRFKLADEKLKPQGIRVRCTHCNEVFTVSPPAPATPEPPPMPEPATPPPASPSRSDLDLSDLNLDEESHPSPASEPAAGDEEFDFGEFNMEDFDEPEAPDQTERAGESAEFVESGEAEEFDFPSLDDADPSELPAGEREVVPEDLPPLEDFDLDDGGFDGLDSTGQAGSADSLPTELVFEDEPAIGGDLGETFEDEAFGERLPELDDAFSGGPQEFSFEEESANSSLKGSGGGNSGPGEFSFGERSPIDDSAFAQKGSSGGAGFAFEEEEPGDQKDHLFADLGITASEPPPTPSGAAPAARAAAKTGRATAPPPRAARTTGQKTRRRKKKNHRRGPLLFLLFVLLLAGGYGYFGWTQGIYDPAVLIERAQSMFLGRTTPQQIGLIEIRNLRNQFVTNQRAGQLFVVQGEVVNRFNGARSSISVKGVIYDKDGKAILQQTVFCGNPLDEAALRTLPYAKIEESMNNQFGEALSNLNLGPDQAIPFTVVFRNLPSEIAQFNVEVADSRPGTK